MNVRNQSNAKYWIYFCVAFVPFICEYNYTYIDSFSGNVCAIFSHFKVYYLILPFVIYFTGLRVRKVLVECPLKCSSFYVCIPASFFALFLLFGESYETLNTWELVFDVQNGQLVKSAVLFSGWFSFLSYGIAICYIGLDYIQRHRILPSLKKTSRFNCLVRLYLAFLQRHPFRSAFLTLSLVYGPLLILAFPGNLDWDNHMQIVQGFKNIANFIPAEVKHVPGWVNLTDHHPLIHTMLLHWCIIIGMSVFSSPCVGIFLFTILQVILVFVVISLANVLLVKTIRWSSWVPSMLLLVFCLHPRIGALMFDLTKDTLYGASFLGLIISMFLRYFSLRTGRQSVKTTLLFLLFCFSVAIFRNEGKYVVLLACLAEFVLIKESRLYLSVCVLPILFVLIYALSVAVPYALQAAEANKLDTLCVPIQQIARCVASGHLPANAEEQELLKQMFDEEKLAKYNPSLADPAKFAARFVGRFDVIVPLGRLWWSFLRDYPGTCLEATLHHHYMTFYPKSTYSFFSPSRKTDQWLGLVNEKSKYIGVHFEKTPWLHKVYVCIELARDKAASLTPIGVVIVNASSYVWCVILLTFYALSKRNKEALSLLAPFYAVMLMLVLGPCGGDYQRYISPFYFAFPILIPCVLKLTFNRFHS